MHVLMITSNICGEIKMVNDDIQILEIGYKNMLKMNKNSNNFVLEKLIIISLTM